MMFEDLEFQHSLGSDNHSGVHPRVIEALIAVNRGSAHAYGMDEVSDLTRGEFRRVFGESVQPEYVFTGTAANVLCLSGPLRRFEAVICADNSHLHVDECSAIENFAGIKLWPLPTVNGKISPEQCLPLLERMGDQHFSQPRAVTLTQPTETGICYTLDELRAWRKFTRDRNLMLHIDGARLANAAIALGCSLREMTADIGVDSVSLGGTKNGLMGAEACLLFSDEAKRDFKFHRKQAMQLSSKTRFLAAQFYVYLKDDLWREIATHSHTQALELAARLKDFPEVEIAYPVESNALFVHLPKAWIQQLRKKHFFYIWDVKTNLCRWMIGFDWNRQHSDSLIAALQETRKLCSPNE